jgi:hypothetical protein
LNGINSVYQYICKPSGEVMWRKFPCFCPECSFLEWEKCPNKKLVGELKTFIEEDE